jgi:hypothetical protein
MNTRDPEELLRETLSGRASRATAALTLDDIRRGAAAQQRSHWRTAAGIAAAAAVLVGVPAALYLRPGSEAPSPTPSPSVSPSVSPSRTPTTAPTSPGLASIPRGKDPGVTYLRDGVVYEPDGSTTRLPTGATDVVDFTPYHGGWIVLDSAGGLAQYDHTGSVVLRSQEGEAALAISPDQLRTAYQVGGHLRVGISTGMGDGESDLSVVGLNARLVGFLGDRVVYNADHSVRAVDEASRESVVRGLTWADAASPAGDLVAGRGQDGSGLEVVSADTGRVLDAQTGAVVANGGTLGLQALPQPPTAWEDHDLLIPYRDGSSWALLRLSPSGSVHRASEVVESSADAPPFVFAARP